MVNLVRGRECFVSLSVVLVYDRRCLYLELEVVVVVVTRVASVVPLARVLVLPSLILTFSSLAFFTTLSPDPTLHTKLIRQWGTEKNN